MADRVAQWVAQHSPPPLPYRQPGSIVDRDSSPEVVVLQPKPFGPQHRQRQMSTPLQDKHRGVVDLTGDDSPPASFRPTSFAAKGTVVNKGKMTTPKGFDNKPRTTYSPLSDKSPNSSSGSIRIVPSPPSNLLKQSIGLSAKERAFAQIRSENASRGIPIGAPSKAPVAYNSALYSVPESKTIDLTAPDDETGSSSLRKSVDQDGNAHYFVRDPEKELKDLVQGTYDYLDDVDDADADPEGLTCKLLPHQITGVAWLKSREKGKRRGGILADDMGLGKTVQSIALIVGNRPSRTRDKDGNRPPKGTLIVGPVALLEQWADEIRKKADEELGLKIYIHHGPDRTKDVKKLEKYHVVITSYTTIQAEDVKENDDGGAPSSRKKGKKKSPAPSDSDDSVIAKANKKSITKGEKTLGPILLAKFHRVILDEAHTIKNHTSKTARACYKLQAKYRWCLTGTPIQNKVDDVFALFKFLGPDIVQKMCVWERFRALIKDPLSREKDGVAIERLQKLFTLILLRRKKTTMVDGKPLLTLPARNVVEVKIDFVDADEREFYNALRDKAELQINKFMKAGTVMNNYMSVLTLLLRLRQACSHPALVAGPVERDALVVAAPSKSKEEAFDAEVDDLAALLGGFGLAANKKCNVCLKELSSEKGERSEMCTSCRKQAEAFEKEGHQWSTKIRKCMELLKEIRDKDEPGKKTIIFSQFTQMFTHIEPFLKREKIRYVMYTGKLTKDEKEESLRKIKNDDRYTVILLSLKCGALGLNLTCCSNVFLTDVWWNGSIEDQAIDRAHRFGQKHPVNIYKITITDTIEEKIVAMQDMKRQIASAAIDGGAGGKQKLTAADIAFLFSRD